MNLLWKGLMLQCGVYLDIDDVFSWFEAGSESWMLLVVLQYSAYILVVSVGFVGVVSDEQDSASTPSILKILTFLGRHIMLVNRHTITALFLYTHPVHYSAVSLVERQLLGVVLGALFYLGDQGGLEIFEVIRVEHVNETLFAANCGKNS